MAKLLRRYCRRGLTRLTRSASIGKMRCGQTSLSPDSQTERRVRECPASQHTPGHRGPVMSVDLVNNLLSSMNENERLRKAVGEIESLSDNCVNAEYYT